VVWISKREDSDKLYFKKEESRILSDDEIQARCTLAGIEN
jgi:hypothetical protein